jgi:hypothetical protein
MYQAKAVAGLPLLSARFMLGSLLDPEDGCDIFLQNVR